MCFNLVFENLLHLMFYVRSPPTITFSHVYVEILTGTLSMQQLSDLSTLVSELFQLLIKLTVSIKKKSLS